MKLSDYQPEPVRGTQKMLEKFTRITCEAKLDGIRYLLAINDGEISLTGRRTSDVTNKRINRIDSAWWLRDSLNAVSNIPNIILDGEMYHPKGLQILLGMMNAHEERRNELLLEHGYPIFYVFDCLNFGGDDLRQNQLKRRRVASLAVLEQSYNRVVGIEAFIRHIPILSRVSDNTEESIKQSFDDAIALGHEGIIIKNLDGPYHKNQWVKLKTSNTYDLVIMGYDNSESITYATNGIAAINLGLYDADGRLHFVSKCSGMKDEIKALLFMHGTEYIGQVAEVGAQEMFPTGALRHPRFIRLRPDLSATDQTFTKYNLEKK